MDLTTILKLLPVVGPVVAKTAEFVEWYHEASSALHPVDQRTAKDALADIQADNDEGHARLQHKLASAQR
jgi:hypothetical protein